VASKKSHRSAGADASRAFSVTRVIPVLRIFDVAKAREFYLDFLGCQVDFEHRFHDDAPLFMQVSRDGMILRLSEHHGDGTPGTHITIEVTGVDDLHRELQAKKYRYMNPGVQDSEFGTRDLGVIDPFGNRLLFSERVTTNS
jgi:catechol 2,3-dioxygenase-like lactoylglutathione lyase family enzyme